MPKRFEYLDTCILAKWLLADDGRWEKEHILQTKLNKFGGNGWELVFIKQITTTPTRTLYNVIFKREII